MSVSFNVNDDYNRWLESIKQKVKSSQIKAAIKVNTELLKLYWDLGKQIIEKQKSKAWGDALIPQLARDLTNAFPGSKGFSERNLFYIRKWVSFYDRPEIVQQLAAQLPRIDRQSFNSESEIVPQLVAQMPWGHNRTIIDKCKTIEEAIFYLQQTLEFNWSRTILEHHIESRLHLRKAKALHNFEHTLEKIQADLANETLKNPYNFDFLTMGPQAHEKDLENALATHMQKFLLELGHGFAFVGKQYALNVGGDDYYIDLLFYHLRLRCFIVVKLKLTKFQPEYVGKLNLYLNVVDDILKHATDQPSIGILLCKTPNKVLVEYSLKNISSPLGIAEYKLVESVPENLKGDLPSIEELEAELKKSQHS